MKRLLVVVAVALAGFAGTSFTGAHADSAVGTVVGGAGGATALCFTAYKSLGKTVSDRATEAKKEVGK